MPYYIYKITPGPTDLTRSLENLEYHDTFKAAKNKARQLRTEMDSDDNRSIKVIFANSELHADEMLMLKREQPILREWEK
ncbi:hypothetical protein MNBD_GAMMA13-1780 [hydrothermal vent metagenome]|uniref:Uncharacterized protein n=1 Tax=hydrothermal vent metagenome TaxID=652676 RepID=A0A3B0YQ89_9ZZZZ